MRRGEKNVIAVEKKETGKAVGEAAKESEEVTKKKERKWLDRLEEEVRDVTEEVEVGHFILEACLKGKGVRATL